MSNSKTVYNLGYRGGSGGFLLLHLLLLSGHYRQDIFNGIDFNDIVKNQWNIDDHDKWKNNEVWPINGQSLSSASLQNNLLFFCNPTEQEFFQKSQIVDFASNCYNDVKDPSWPDVKSAADFEKLPSHIYNEIYSVLDCKDALDYLRNNLVSKSVWLYTDFYSQNELAYYKKAYYYFREPSRSKIQDFDEYADIWQDTLVDKKAIYFLNHSDIQIRLQDLVNNPKILVQYQLVEQITQQQFELINHWKKLHPPDLLEKIGINNK